MKWGRFFLSVLEHRSFLVWMAVAGLLLRIALILLTSSHGNNTFADEDDYQSLGASLSHGGPYSIDGVHLSAFRSPAEAWLIALMFHFFGPHVLPVKLLEALLLTILPFACRWVGRSMGLSLAAANAAGALASLHPALAYASTTLYPTALATVALTLGIVLSVFVLDGRAVLDGGAVLEGKAVLDGKAKGFAAGAGLAFGLAALTTAAFAPIALAAGFVMAVKRRYAAATIVALLGTLPVLAWMARNKVELDEFTVATNGGINLFLGANDYATPMSGNNIPGRILVRLPQYEEVKLDRIYRVRVAEWVKAHPARWAKLVFLRGILVFDSVGNPATQGLHSGMAAHIVGWLMLPVVLLGVIGLVLSYRLPVAWITGTAVFLIVLSSALTLTKPRFRFPCDPALCVFAAVGYLELRKRSLGRHLDPAREVAPHGGGR